MQEIEKGLKKHEQKIKNIKREAIMLKDREE
jgi:hypothetical protein